MADDLIKTTGCAAFRVDPNGVIRGWNPAAETFFGLPSDRAVGRPCHEVVAGRDLFGNRFCDGSCSVRNMARRGEPVQHFVMDVLGADGRAIRAGCCTLVEPGVGGGGPGIVHVLQPVAAGGFPSPTADEDDRPAGDDGDASDPAGFLTPREQEVLALLDRGEPTRQIAERLDISVTTVRNHIQGILRKLGAHSRLEAVSVARRQGLL